VFAVGKYNVSLCRNMHAPELVGKGRTFADLHARQILEAARPVQHVGTDPVGGATHLSGDSANVNRETLPQRGDIVECASGVSAS
jgi:hypothetical protein